MSHAKVLIVSSLEQREQAFEIRRRVFRNEQHVPEEEEFDSDDEIATHALALVGGQPAGTGRLVMHPDYAKIGRMAVLPEFRGSGVGLAILHTLMDLATQRGAKLLMLHAQVQAIPFYRKAGFAVSSEEFEEAGIPHRRMERPTEAKRQP
ncbi:MAG: GNAT family N-acetyltransferase [Deltaproteobacteria bacterium]|nr:GNAT family N-acetyltransferase [Deltaproteobacteria bacterium]